MISLKEIGRICGVAESTVSKALKDHPGIKLATRQRIQEVASKHNYQPNAMVQCIQSGKSKSIGIAYNCFKDPFAGAVLDLDPLHRVRARRAWRRFASRDFVSRKCIISHDANVPIVGYRVWFPGVPDGVISIRHRVTHLF